MQDVLRSRRRRGYDPHDERYYVSDTNTGRRRITILIVETRSLQILDFEFDLVISLNVTVYCMN